MIVIAKTPVEGTSTHTALNMHGRKWKMPLKGCKQSDCGASWRENIDSIIRLFASEEMLILSQSSRQHREGRLRAGEGVTPGHAGVKWKETVVCWSQFLGLPRADC